MVRCKSSFWLVTGLMSAMYLFLRHGAGDVMIYISDSIG